MNELRRIDLNLLLTLHALLTEKHVTRAAQRLHKSQPAVSHALAQLRVQFEDPLLVRRGGKMVLTARAKALMQPLHDALTSLNGLLGGSMAFDPSQARGRFRIAMSDYATRIVLPRLARHVREFAPGLDLAVSQVSRDAMLVQLTDGELDLALGLFPDAPDHIRVQTLFSDGYISVADKSTLPVDGGLSLEEWLRRPHILVALRPDSNDEIERALALIGLERRIAVVLPRWGAAADLLVGTDLILTVASRTVEHIQRHNALHQFTPPLKLSRFAYQQGWHVRSENDATHHWLRQAVLSCSQPETDDALLTNH
ncbi:LysR family transcriptional regulator [Dickeya dadantii]|uniref:LysR family transcriptional regulator n=1 Tax=Dickeya dadantii TaxID=204038 RepID=UPI0013731153|nr:LysR family transcriptional regulator [Dickeya dadantii]NAT76054.1 LysR family transcriptional regulator [Dickeya dadantii]NPE62247.1 LysR family transcriptional regulator [Dickeya dadantii]